MHSHDARRPFVQQQKAMGMPPALEEAVDRQDQRGAPSGDGSGRFEDGSSWRDPIFVIIFAVHWILLLVLVFVVRQNSEKAADEEVEEDPETGEERTTTSFSDTNSVVGSLVLCIFLACLWGIFWMFCMRKWPTGMIKAALIAQVVCLLAFSIMSFAAGAVVGGVLFLLFAGLSAFIAYMMRHLIPFSAALLKMSTELTQMYRSTIYLAFAGLGAMILYMLFWSWACVTVSVRNGGGGAFVYLLFSMFWTTQVFKNIVHTSVSGCIGSWYFLSHTPHMPPSPLKGALKRSLTTSLGSIIFGSLLVATVKFIRFMVNQAMKHSNQEFIRCICNCLLGMVERLVELFNLFAFTRVAIYGDAYIPAAKKTWAMVKERGIDMLWNDNLTGAVLWMGSLVGGVIVAIAAFIWTDALIENDKLAEESRWILVLGALVVGIVLITVLLSPIESAIATVFVCYADEPETLRQANISYYTEISEALAHRRSGGTAQTQQNGRV